MGWNDWAHYQCHYTAQTILSNARALVKTGLAARGYDRVTIDDCWMGKTRAANGNLQPNAQRFPHGMKPVANTVHKLGLHFGIYEDGGYETCAKFAGMGHPKGGGKAHFFQDARLFASWDIDYAKLDLCNIQVPPGSTRLAVYHKLYATYRAALTSTGLPIILEAPGAFQGTPNYYDMLRWAHLYGQMSREGTDIEIFRADHPDRPRFHSVLWNYAYNLQLGRYQEPDSWDYPDFMIAGDKGLSLAESRSQMALWSMMSAPLILSSDVAKLSPQALSIVGNKAVIAIDQDPLGRMATLVSRTPKTDVLFKRLADGEYAAAVLNRSEAPVKVDLNPAEFGFAASSRCRLDAKNLWNGREQSSVSTLQAEVASHDTTIWRVRASAQCGMPSRTGTITLTSNVRTHLHTINGYTRCLASPGSVESCVGTAAERWTVTPDGALRSSGDECLALAHGKPLLEECRPVKSQHWRYTLRGNLISSTDHQCLSSAGLESEAHLEMQPCGHNLPNQIWSLPN